MANPSFTGVVSGLGRVEAVNLVFPESYHTCFACENRALPFIMRAGKKIGRPAFYITEEEIDKLADHFKYTLVGKFSARIPPMELIRRHFELLKLKGTWNIGSLDNRHIVVKLSMEEDYAFLFAKKLYRIENIHARFLKWTLDFDLKSEPPIAPVWLRLPGLKLHFFHKQFLYSIASAFGKPLKLDLPTYNISRPSVARILVEMNITTPHAEEVWIGTQTIGYWQKVEIDSLPRYCSNYKIFGHTLENCFITKPYLRKDRHFNPSHLQNGTDYQDQQFRNVSINDNNFAANHNPTFNDGTNGNRRQEQLDLEQTMNASLVPVVQVAAPIGAPVTGSVRPIIRSHSLDAAIPMLE